MERKLMPLSQAWGYAGGCLKDFSVICEQPYGVSEVYSTNLLRTKPVGRMSHKSLCKWGKAWQPPFSATGQNPSAQFLCTRWTGPPLSPRSHGGSWEVCFLSLTLHHSSYPTLFSTQHHPSLRPQSPAYPKHIPPRSPVTDPPRLFPFAH